MVRTTPLNGPCAELVLNIGRKCEVSFLPLDYVHVHYTIFVAKAVSCCLLSPSGGAVAAVSSGGGGGGAATEEKQEAKEEKKEEEEEESDDDMGFGLFD